MMSSGLSKFGLWDFFSSRQLQIGDVELKRCGRLPGREGLMTDVFELHYGKCRIEAFWNLTNIKDL